MKKKFLSSFLLLFVVNLFIKPAWLFSDLLVQRTTGEAYGQYFVLFNLSLLFNMILDLGISNYNNRKIAGNQNQFITYFSKIIVLRFALAILYLLTLTVSFLVFKLSSFEIKCLLVLGINQMLLAFITYFRSNLTALGFFKWDSFISILDRVIMSGLMLSIIFAHLTVVDIALFIKVQFIGYFFTFFISLCLLIYKGARLKFKWDYKFSSTLLRKSFPYALIVVLMSAYTYSDSIMLDQMTENGNWENMIYAQSHRILMAGNNYVYLVAVLLLPIFSQLIKKKKEVEGLLRLSGGLVIYFISLAVLLAHLYNVELINLLYAKYNEVVPLHLRFVYPSTSVLNKAEIYNSAKVFSVLIIGLIPLSFNYIYGVLLTAGGHMKVLNRIAFVTLTLNLAVNYLLIPLYGAYGAAIASVGTQLLAGIGQWFYAYKIYSIKFPLLHFIKFIGLLTGLYFVFNFMKPHFQTIEGILLFTISGIPLILLLRIITWQNIKTHFLKR